MKNDFFYRKGKAKCTRLSKGITEQYTNSGSFVVYLLLIHLMKTVEKLSEQNLI